MADKWIQKAHMHKGAFTKKANAAGMTPAAYAHKVLAKGAGYYDEKTRKQAQLALTLRKMHH